jgi:hypothetical protein
MMIILRSFPWQKDALSVVTDGRSILTRLGRTSSPSAIRDDMNITAAPTRFFGKLPWWTCPRCGRSSGARLLKQNLTKQWLVAARSVETGKSTYRAERAALFMRLRAEAA